MKSGFDGSKGSSRETGVTAEMHVEADLHDVNGMFEARDRVDVHVGETVLRKADEIVLGLRRDVSQKGYFHARSCRPSDEVALYGGRPICRVCRDNLHVGCGSTALHVGEPLTHRVADTTGYRGERTIAQEI